MKRQDVHGLERLGELTDVVRCGRLEKADFTLGYPFMAQDVANVLKQGLAVLEVNKRPVKYTV